MLVLLWLGSCFLLPDYHRRFGLRGQVRRHADLAADLPLACYPKRWDSVSFYLNRNDVRVFTPDRREQLLEELAARPSTLVFVKSGPHAQELLDDLPVSFEFLPMGRQGSVRVGLVRERPSALPLMAQPQWERTELQVRAAISEP